MSRLAVAVFTDSQAARSAGHELRRRRAEHARANGRLHLDCVRVHEESIDPMLGHDLKATTRQTAIDRGLVARTMAPLAGGILAGFAIGQLFEQSVQASAGWTLLGAMLGLAISIALVLAGPRAGYRRRALASMRAALRRGDAVLSVRFEPSAQTGIADVLRRHGARLERLV